MWLSKPQFTPCLREPAPPGRNRQQSDQGKEQSKGNGLAGNINSTFSSSGSTEAKEWQVRMDRVQGAASTALCCVSSPGFFSIRI